MQDILLIIRYFERQKEDYQIFFEKLTLFFPSNPVFFNEESCQKQKGPGTIDPCSSGYETSSQKFIY